MLSRHFRLPDRMSNRFWWLQTESAHEMEIPDDVLQADSGREWCIGEESMADKSTDTPKRLVRTREGRMLAGVASGLGRYFGIDPVLVRLVFVILALAGGGGVLAYIVAWIIIPEEAGPGVAQGDGENGSSSVSATSATAGILLIALGGMMLAAQLIPAFQLRFLGPIILVGVGVLLLARRESQS